MRACVLALIPMFAVVPTWQAAAADIGLPTHAFSVSWTSLPTGSFSPPALPGAPFEIYSTRVLAGRASLNAHGRSRLILEEAFASAADTETRLEIALDEMMTPWDQGQRSALQRLRDAEAAFVGGKAARGDRFAALLSRVVDGTGRSVARDGSAAPALDTAYVAALSRQDDAARAETEAAQKAFLVYRDAFVAFADGRSPGTGVGVADELDRERAADLAH